MSNSKPYWCPRCGIEPSLPTHSYCRECRNEYAREHRAKRKAEGLCGWCGRRVDGTGRGSISWCKEHREMHRARMEGYRRADGVLPR